MNRRITQTRHAGTVFAVVAIISLTLGACAPQIPFIGEASPTPRATPSISPATPTAVAEQGPLRLEVTATGEVQARQDAELTFNTSGIVDRVLVSEGAMVQAGDLLAILDPRRFEQDIRNAEAALQQARARLAGLAPTSPELRQAAAGVEQARAQLNQVQGSVTAADIEAARQQLIQARASLEDLLSGPDEVDVRAATAQRDAAVAGLESQRSQLSQAKTQAQIQLAQASNQLWAAQQNYSSTYWNWRSTRDIEAGDIVPAEIPIDIDLDNLTDQLRQFFGDQLIQATVQLRNAEQQVAAARVQYEQAREAEISGIQQAEAQVTQAQASLDRLLQPPDPNQVAQARAAVANAQAQLNRLTGQQRSGQLQAAQAGLAQARAGLDQLQSAPTEPQRAQAEAAVTQAAAALEQAQLNREYAEIRAPFAGEVSVIGIDLGDTVSPGAPVAIRIVDMDRLYVDVYINEAVIAQVEPGLPVTLIADALPGRPFSGTVTYVAPTATDRQGVTSYQVQIEIGDPPEQLRVGMSVVVTIAGTTSTAGESGPSR